MRSSAVVIAWRECRGKKTRVPLSVPSLIALNPTSSCWCCHMPGPHPHCSGFLWLGLQASRVGNQITRSQGSELGPLPSSLILGLPPSLLPSLTPSLYSSSSGLLSPSFFSLHLCLSLPFTFSYSFPLCLSPCLPSSPLCFPFSPSNPYIPPSFSYPFSLYLHPFFLSTPVSRSLRLSLSFSVLALGPLSLYCWVSQ